MAEEEELVEGEEGAEEGEEAGEEGVGGVREGEVEEDGAGYGGCYALLAGHVAVKVLCLLSRPCFDSMYRITPSQLAKLEKCKQWKIRQIRVELDRGSEGDKKLFRVDVHDSTLHILV